MSIQKRKAILLEALKCKDIKSLDKDAFLGIWKAIAFLFSGLHPDGFEDDDSGWPEELKPFAEEAWRRYEENEISGEDIYPAEEARKGINATCH
jgi:hypothetical protein